MHYSSSNGDLEIIRKIHQMNHRECQQQKQKQHKQTKSWNNQDEFEFLSDVIIIMTAQKYKKNKKKSDIKVQ